MTPQSSLFLDAARFAAALVVLLSHLTDQNLNAVLPWAHWAEESVVVFFVISGYVIGYVADTRENTGAEFAAARLGRLYSVMLPALGLTIVLDAVGMARAPGLYIDSDHQYSGLRILANLLFIQQSWNATVVPLSNGPFWSLAYEFWYYAIFAAWHFLRGKARIACLGLAMLCAGPRILASFPLWLLGLATYHASIRWHPRTTIKGLVFAGSAIALCQLLRMDNPIAWLDQLTEATFPDRHISVAGMHLFLGDIPRLPYKLLVAALFAVMVFCTQGTLPSGAWQARGANMLRYLAGSTFSLYLFHAPLIYFFFAVFNVQKTSANGIVLAGLAVVAACVALSHLFERRVAIYRRFFRSVFQLLSRGRKSGAGDAGSTLESGAWTNTRKRNR